MSDKQVVDDIFRAAQHLEHARELHKTVPLCDGHNDIAWFFHDLEPAGPSGLRSIDLRKNNKGSVMRDIPRLRDGGVGWQFWSVYTPAMDIGPVAVQTTLEQIDIVYRMVDMYSDVFEIAYNAEDVRRIFASGKIASMMGMEGGHQINCSMASLRMFYRLGVRYMTLTHNGGPTWADSAVSITGEFIHDAPNNGLSPFGKEVVLEMNRIGMLVDLSHVHHVTMRVALEVSRAPVIFSHSSTRALCNHPRDVPDDILRMLPTNGGVVMITFVSKFVAGPFWVRGGKVGATVIEVADHIDHVKEVAGIDHIGIGGDYDGCTSLARGLEDVSCYHNLTAELIYRGYTDEEICKILSGNLMRVLEAAERVRDEMTNEELCMPSESWSSDLQPSAEDQERDEE